MAKPSKQFKKFASSGKLKETIKKRRSIQQSKRKFDEKVAQRQKQRGRAVEEGDEEEDEEVDERDVRKAGAGGRAGGVARNVDELFGGLEGGEDGEDGEDDEDEDLSEGDEDDDDDEEEEAGEEDLERDEEAMKKAMKELEKKDPEFFKYLAENDKGLLDFGDAGDDDAAGSAGQEDEDEDEDMEDGDDEAEDDEDAEDEEEEVAKKVVVTGRMLRSWQEGMLRLHSLRSLRSTLLAFRSAAHMNEDESQGAGGTKYTVNSPAVFNKLVITALKFTPVVLGHHIPVKTNRDGRFKVTQPKKPNPRLTRLILSHFSTLLFFIRSLPSRPVAGQGEADAGGLLLMALSESAKLVPWVLGARKHIRAYLKVLLELWSSASDNVRIAAFLAVRKLFVGGDDAIRDICLKATYRSLLGPLRNTTPHTLPSLNLLKNTASELFLLAPAQSYPQAFTAIRMLAVHLRDCIRDVTAAPSTSKQGAEGAPGARKGGDQQEAFRKVYNWQFVHTIDFWCRTLGTGCSKETERERGGVKSELEPLVYPLVQVALGVIRLLPSSRYFPLRFHILHSLLSLSSKTSTYIPLTPYLLEMLDSAEFRSAGKKSTLKALDLEYIVRAPQAYPRTRIYQETLAEELVYLLGAFHAQWSTHVAFPEIALPAVLSIRRHIKKGTAGSPKAVNQLKTLVDKLEDTRKYVEGKRRGVSFAPRDRAEVGRFEEGLEAKKTPVGAWVAVLGKARERKRVEVEKALREERD